MCSCDVEPLHSGISSTRQVGISGLILVLAGGAIGVASVRDQTLVQDYRLNFLWAFDHYLSVAFFPEKIKGMATRLVTRP